jgi:hypothetical protein
MKRILSALTAALFVAFATGCSGGGSSSTPSFTGATIRFVNGSPDAGTVDVAVGAPTNVIFTKISYGGFGAYSLYTTKSNPDIYVYQSGTQNLVAGRTLPDGTKGTGVLNLTDNQRFSGVLAGSVLASTALLLQFQEPSFNTPTGAGAVAIHHASPSTQNVSFQVGYYVPAIPSVRYSLGTIAYGAAPLTVLTLPNPPSGTGIGFYALAPPLPTFGYTPSQIDPSNVNNVLGTTGEQNISLYVVDGPASGLGSTTVQYIGAFDPNI